MRTCSQHTLEQNRIHNKVFHTLNPIQKIFNYMEWEKEEKRRNFIIFVIDPHFAFSPLVIMWLSPALSYIFFSK